MLQIVYYFLLIISLLYAGYYGVMGLFAFFGLHKTPIGQHEPKHKFGVLIAARNEACVIGPLIKSLKAQNYPGCLYEIFAIPNNCTDDTEKQASEAGAEIIKCNAEVKGKSDALRYAFAFLEERGDIDAYLIFDADNIVHPNFMRRMNDALCGGYKTAQGFRDGKNRKDNWLTGCYTLFFYLQNFLIYKSRMNINGSAVINGTGFMIKKEVIDEYGFNTVTMTEDCEFAAQCAINNIKIAFVEDAVTYDEHPSSFKVSWKQRKRWSAGTFQCLKAYWSELIKACFKNRSLACFDMLMLFLAPAMQIFNMVFFVIIFFFKIGNIDLSDIDIQDVISYNIYMYNIIIFLCIYFGGVAVILFIVKYNRKPVKELLSGTLLFTVFTLSWIPIHIASLFKRTRIWEPIRHDRNISIDF